MPRRVVVTGGPGGGKTTLLNALRAAQGVEYVPESARAVIQERKRRGLSPRPEPEAFARAILRRDIEGYRSVPAGAETVFFDRGIPDALGMLHELGLLTRREAKRLLASYPYFRNVLVLPPWEAIYTTDSERDQSYADAVRVHDTVCEWYVRCGYELVEVPRLSIPERCAFVLRTLTE